MRRILSLRRRRKSHAFLATLPVARRLRFGLQTHHHRCRFAKFLLLRRLTFGCEVRLELDEASIGLLRAEERILLLKKCLTPLA